jgi:hypothetical protein
VKNPHRLLLVVLLSLGSSAATAPLLAQSSVLEANRNLVTNGPPASPPGAQKMRRLPVEATASIDFGNDALVTVSSRQGRFDRVGLRHDQTVDIAVQYPDVRPGATIAVEALDGGQIIAVGKSLTVGADGTIRFKFRAGHQPGNYQIVLRQKGRELGLQFWVRDEENPRNNPPVVDANN